MDKQLESGVAVYPLVRHAQGGPAPDGKSLLVEATAPNGEPVRFAISLTDVQHFVSFLLISARRISAMRDDPAQTLGGIGQIPPIPVTSIAVGEPVGDEGYLGIAVGPAKLVFSVPTSVFSELGRTLMTMSAGPNGGYAA